MATSPAAWRVTLLLPSILPVTVTAPPVLTRTTTELPSIFPLIVTGPVATRCTTLLPSMSPFTVIGPPVHTSRTRLWASILPFTVIGPESTSSTVVPFRSPFWVHMARASGDSRPGELGHASRSPNPDEWSRPCCGRSATPSSEGLARNDGVGRRPITVSGTVRPEEPPMTGTDVTLDADVVVVGAGMSGLYALKVLRERGLRVVVLEKGDGVGGTWYWNRYPGARCDIPSMEYSFGFDPELEQEWVWTEHFASQPEIERYLNHLADRYDLRRDIRLGCGVSAATFDETTDTWVFDTETGDQVRARFAVMA